MRNPLLPHPGTRSRTNRSVMGPGCRISWYIRCSMSSPEPSGSTSLPAASPGGWPSMNTRNRTDDPRAGGPITRWTSRASNRRAIRPFGLVQDDGLRRGRPVTREGPMVPSKRVGDVVDASLVRREPSGGSEAVCSPVAQVRLARPEAAPIGGYFRALRVHGDELVLDPFDPGFGQELLDHDLRPVVVAFTEPVMPDASLGVDEVQSRPVVVRERVPDRVVAVDRDRVRDPHLLAALRGRSRGPSRS